MVVTRGLSRIGAMAEVPEMDGPIGTGVRMPSSCVTAGAGWSMDLAEGRDMLLVFGR